MHTQAPPPLCCFPIMSKARGWPCAAGKGSWIESPEAATAAACCRSNCCAGKLDWVLLRRLRVHATAEGNGSYAISDHKWLSADVTLEQ